MGVVLLRRLFNSAWETDLFPDGQNVSSSNPLPLL